MNLTNSMILLGKKISLFVYDFDGVMTDNRAMIFNNGDESVLINRSDGLAIEKIKSFGIDQIIISTETNDIVMKRAEKLGIFAVNGVKNKLEELNKYITKKKLALSQTAYIGNDINDIEAMSIVGVKIAPSDSAPEILEIADYVTNTKGGFGVIREVLSRLKEENK
tara:strand:+ start:3836 stop:4333 length:498 start_codon:yes stop_codon:yes gene_type:complete